MSQSVRLLLLAGLLWAVATASAMAGPIAPALKDAIQKHDLAAVRAALNAGADPNGTWEPPSKDNEWWYGSTPLGYASNYGDLEIVKLLLDRGAKVNQPSSVGDSPLWLATRNDSVEIAELLLAKGADKNYKNASGVPLVFFASSEGSEKCLKLFLDLKLDPNAQSDGRPPIVQAGDRRHVESIMLLAEYGADVNAMDVHGCSAMTESVWHGDVPVVTALLNLGVDPNGRKGDGTTYLGLAVANSQTDVAALLVEHGADPLLPETAGWLNGFSPWGDAIHNSKDAIVEKFLNRGVPPDSPTPRNPALVDAAADHEDSQAAAIVKQLLEAGAHPDAWSTIWNRSALHTAAEDGRLETVRLLLSHGANSRRGNSDETPISAAVVHGHPRVVGLLLNTGISPNTRDPKGRPLLTLAVENGNADTINILLKRGANPMAIRKSDGKNALDLAREKHLSGVVKMMERQQRILLIVRLAFIAALLGVGAVYYKRRNPTVQLVTGGTATPLWHAAADGDVATINQLVQARARVDATDREGVPALSIAASNGHREAVEALIRHGANPVQLSQSGWTPLCYAAKGGHVAVMELLIARGAEAASGTFEGTPAICLAAEAGQTEAVRFLLDRGVSPNAADASGIPALWFAAGQGHAEVVALLLDRHANLHGSADAPPLLFLAAELGFPEVVNVLVQRGAPLGATFQNASALYRAAELDRQVVVETLLANGASVETDRLGMPLLYFAVTKQKPWLVKALLDAGADPNRRQRGGLGWSPLLAAASGGNAEIVELLLNAGADPTSLDETFRSPAEVAKQAGHEAAATMLLQAQKQPTRESKP